MVRAVCGWSAVEALNNGKSYRQLLTELQCSRDELVLAVAAERARRMEAALEDARFQRGSDIQAQYAPLSAA